jgi:exodeoxyribonuclease X
MNCYALDTETTDAGDAPEVIQLAIMGPLASVHAEASTQLLHFRPTKPISIGALATHNIIEADLVDAPPWTGYSLPSDCGYLIGHAIDFDWKAIGSPNVKRICTLALARSVWPDLDSHNLTALMYHLYPHALARDLVKNAHDAAADVALCSRLLLALFDVIDQPASWESLWRVSEEARMPKIFSFGKYKGEAIADIKRTDRGYINWCVSGKCDLVNEDPYLRQALLR